MPGPYDDILYLSRPKNGRHAPMPKRNRAAQFLPFSALTGLEQVMEEEQRLTDPFIELGEDARAALDEAISSLLPVIDRHPRVKVTYFVPDETKPGGRYENKTHTLRRLDRVNRTLTFTDGTVVDLDNILSLEPLL